MGTVGQSGPWKQNYILNWLIEDNRAISITAYHTFITEIMCWTMVCCYFSPMMKLGGEIGIVHYSDVIVVEIYSQITSLMFVYSTVYSGADQRKHQNSVSLASVWGIHQWPVNSLHKWPVTRKMFPFDDVIIEWVFMHVYICLFAHGEFLTIPWK